MRGCVSNKDAGGIIGKNGGNKVDDLNGKRGVIQKEEENVK